MTAWSRSTAPGSGPCPTAAAAVRRGGQRRDRRLGGGWADGLITVDQPPDRLRRRDRGVPGGGGEGKPVACRCTCPGRPTTKPWRSPAISGVRDVFDSALTMGSRDLAEQFDERPDVSPRGRSPACSSPLTRAGTSPGSTSWLDLGFDALYLHQVGSRAQERFIDVFGARSSRSSRAGSGMKITATSDQWWKKAVVYCLDVETVLRLGRRRDRRLRRAHPADRLPGRAGRDLPLADAVLPDPEPRRRLRHHRLLRRRPAARHPRRLRRVPRTARERGHAGDRRPGRQPHLGRASVVPGGSGRAATRATATTTSGATSPRRSPRTSCSRATRTSIWEFDELAGQYYLHRFYR